MSLLVIPGELGTHEHEQVQPKGKLLAASNAQVKEVSVAILAPRVPNTGIACRPRLAIFIPNLASRDAEHCSTGFLARSRAAGRSASRLRCRAFREGNDAPASHIRKSTTYGRGPTLRRSMQALSLNLGGGTLSGTLFSSPSEPRALVVTVQRNGRDIFDLLGCGSCRGIACRYLHMLLLSGAVIGVFLMATPHWQLSLTRRTPLKRPF